jgi:hypothetical protein
VSVENFDFSWSGSPVEDISIANQRLADSEVSTNETT